MVHDNWDAGVDVAHFCSARGSEHGAVGVLIKQDLFKCGLTVACPEMWRFEGGLEFDELACATELVTSGKPGVLFAMDDAWTYLDQTESLIILRGDGTAVLQNRERQCLDPCTIPWDEVPWEMPTVQQQCSVKIPSDIPGGGPGPCWWPWGNLVICTPIDPELSCNNAKAILAQ